MAKIAIVSGWLGFGELREYHRFDDGRSDFVIDLLKKLQSEHEIVTTRSEISQHRSDIGIELHLNVQKPLTQSSTKYCVLLEHPSIRPQNWLRSRVKYKKIFTWDDKLVKKDPKFFRKFNFPHDFSVRFSQDQERDLEFVMIASNRNTVLTVPENLYYVRQHIVTQMNEKHPDRFSLYGHGWEQPFLRHGILPRARAELLKRLGKSDQSDLRVYQGAISEKSEVLSRARFNFVVENIGGLDGYISEKVFDSFMFGAIPIFYPSWNIPNDVIPKDLYIDLREYACVADVIAYCDGLDSAYFNAWSLKVKRFIHREAHKFSCAQFVHTVAEELR